MFLFLTNFAMGEPLGADYKIDRGIIEKDERVVEVINE